MIITTSDTIAGKTIRESKGLVRGNTIRARHMGHDFMASLRGVVGGEITNYTKMMAESREQAIDRMIEEAEAMGANAIVALRFSTSMIMQNAAEILVCATSLRSL